MCGILGVYSYNTKDLSSEEFDLFVDSLKHRGPDGRGAYKDSEENLRLGHRRLSILDLSEAAALPMVYANRYWITFNGEIYNFLEIRKELQQKGYSFRTESDTEVVLASYIEWGEACLYKFNGMWAFVIWDSQDKVLFLSRDRFGVKPLYFYNDGKRFAFASELKAFRCLPDADLRMDLQFLSNALYEPNVMEYMADTSIKNIKKLPAGHYAFLGRSGAISVKRWWNTLDHLVEVPKTFEEQVAHFRELFFDACSIRMRSDVPLGTALSGGLDSSSVMATVLDISRKKRGERLFYEEPKSFSAIYSNTSRDESQFISQMVNHTGASAFYCVISPESLIANLEQVMEQLEETFEPHIGPWLLYREFRKQNVTISIDGHGADELLCGYDFQIKQAMSEALLRGDLFYFLHLKKTLKNLYFPGTFKSKGSFIQGLRLRLRENVWLRKQYQKIAPGKDNGWLRLPYKKPHYLTSSGALDSLTQILYKDFHYTTLPVILRNFDRCSMAHGVEIRAPFLDWRIVAYSFSLSAKAKIGNCKTKYILREAMKGLLPESIRERTIKIGFANPMGEWFASPLLKNFILDQVNSRSFLESNIWKGKVVRAYVEECFSKNQFNEATSCLSLIQANYFVNSFSKS